MIFDDFCNKYVFFWPKLGVATGRKNPKKKKSIFFLFKKQQLCVRFCVLAVVAPKTMIFEKCHTFRYFWVQQKLFLHKIRGRKNWRLASDTTKDFWTPGTKMPFKISPPLFLISVLTYRWHKIRKKMISVLLISRGGLLIARCVYLTCQHPPLYWAL